MTAILVTLALGAVAALALVALIAWTLVGRWKRSQAGRGRP